MRIKIVILVFIIINFIASVSYGTDGIVESQLEVLDMSSIINEGKKYTNEIFPEINIEKCLTEFTKGNIDNSTIFSGIIKVFGRELVNSITLGRLSKFFNLMNQSERVEVSKKWNIKEEDFRQYIKIFSS